jgi:MGT family glycosyltransferase
MTKTNLNPKKILFATLPAEGHLYPVTGLAKHLKDTGHDVRFYMSSFYDDKMKSMDMDYFPITVDFNSATVRDQNPELRTTNDPVEKIKLYQKLYVKIAEGSFDDIRQIYHSFPFDLIVVSNSYPSIPMIRHKFKVPVVSIGVMQLADQSADLAPYQSGLLPAEDEETRKKYAQLYKEYAVLFKEGTDDYAAVLKANGVSFKRAELDDFFGFLVKQATLYLQIGTPGFDYKRSHLGANVRYIGALLPFSKATEKKKWYDERLKKYNKIILVTQGAMESDITKILEPTLQAFIHTDILVIAVTGSKGTQLLRETYAADNLIIEDFIPYAEVMPYADAFVTNGGSGGTLLSIQHQLPLVAAGLHEGKNETCARIGYSGIGIDLKTETPDAKAIYNAVQEIIENKRYKDNIVKLAKEFSTYDSIGLCEKYITELLDKET